MSHAEVKRMEAEALRLVDELKAERDNLAAENARLRQQVAEVATELAETLRDRNHYRGYTKALHADLADRNGECDAMRPIVVAAQAWRAAWSSGWFKDDRNRQLIAAVDAWRAAQPDQKGPTAAPTSTETDERSEDEGDATDATEAQGGVEATLHAELAHPGWEYTTTVNGRKDGMDGRPPAGEGWERNADYHGGWERFDYTEESYWRRRIPEGDETGLVAEDTPADPAGLDAAWDAWWDAWCSAPDRGQPDYDDMAAAVRAAAPHIRRAALLEAADAMEAVPDGFDELDFDRDDCNFLGAWLRERAEREGL